MVVRRRGAVYRRRAEGGCIFILVVVGICDENLSLMTRLKRGSEIEWCGRKVAYVPTCPLES